MMKKILLLCAALLWMNGGESMAQSEKSDRPKAYLVSDAHLDTQWYWDIQTTIKEHVWSTIHQNLFLLKKYPNYIFNFEGGVKYSWMKEYYPTQYEEMKKYIKEGRWHISGASWDATDAIVPSIESAIRNILLGQEYYRHEFGVESTDIFLPDCFGFGWALPTIANHCGLIGFSSQKLGWRDNPFYGDQKYPYTIGLWTGVDGSKIMMTHGFGYSGRWPLEDLSYNRILQRRVKESPLNMVYHYYGTGDIGGSPDLNSVEAVERGLKGDGPLQIISATSDQLYKDFLPYDKHPELPEYNGELLMDVHGTGCYTSQAAMKLYNRQNELLGDAAERSAVAADWLGLVKYPTKNFTDAWRRFIFHQFHDDLTGTSIPRAYEFSWNDELLSLKQFASILETSVEAVSEKLDTRVKGKPIVLYNALGFETTDVVEVQLDAEKCPKNIAVYNDRGAEVPSQLVGYSDGKVHVLIEATVPANGYAVYDLRLSGSDKLHTLKSDAQVLENSVYKLKLDDKGDIVSIFDKNSNKELVKDGKAVRLALFTENKSTTWPAWEIMKSTIDASPVSITDNVRMTMVEDGELRKTLCVEKQYGKSIFRQYIRLYEGEFADRIDFYNEVDWQTTNALLKAEFPLNLDNEKATYDIGLGSIQRGNNTLTAYEVYAHYWADLTDRNDSYGVTIMNDSKYGWDKPDNHTLRLTLLHTPKGLREWLHQEQQDLGYHSFTYSLVGHKGGLQKAQVRQDAEVLNQRIKAFATTKHVGSLGKSFSLLSSDNKNVAIKALKMAESSDEYVVRVYETGGEANQKASLTFSSDIIAAVEADGTEKTIGKADFAGKQLEVSIKPNSIKTYKVKLAKQGEAKLKYQQLALDFDKKCFSWNEFAKDADFESGYSYAAELIPSELTVGRIPFRLENKALMNGMKCEGDTIKLPAGNKYNRLYVLAASAVQDKRLACEFQTGKVKQEIQVPSYAGFVGQWGHTGHTEGYLNEAEVAYVGTHRHSSAGDHHYEFTYMYKFAIDIPEKATEIILPNKPNVVLFAATLVEENHPSTVSVVPLFRTGNKTSKQAELVTNEEVKVNILKPEYVIGCSGYTREAESPKAMLDGNPRTKWCVLANLSSYVDFDLGKDTEIGSWYMMNGASEDQSYVTNTCYLLGKNNENEEWRTIDSYTSNKLNIVNKTLAKPEKVRYLRLLLTHPMQNPNTGDTRVFEFAVY